MNKLITHKHVMGECPNLGPKVVLTNRKSRLTVRKKTQMQVIFQLHATVCSECFFYLALERTFFSLQFIGS